MIRRIQNIAQLKVFIAVSLSFILLGLTFIILHDKTTIHLNLNEWHHPFFDTFFKYWTYLGDGLPISILVLIIGLLSRGSLKWSVLTLGFSTLIVTGLITQGLKHLVYPDAFRPLGEIGREFLYLVPDVEVHQANSFPSGHTSTAFAFFGFLSFVYFRRKPFLQVFAVLCAVLVGYSRMYLSQHFLEDVVTGACVGIISYVIGHLITSAFFKKGICN